jgi:hypothetical protein
VQKEAGLPAALFKENTEAGIPPKLDCRVALRGDGHCFSIVRASEAINRREAPELSASGLILMKVLKTSPPGCSVGGICASGPRPAAEINRLISRTTGIKAVLRPPATDSDLRIKAKIHYQGQRPSANSGVN